MSNSSTALTERAKKAWRTRRRLAKLKAKKLSEAGKKAWATRRKNLKKASRS